MVRPGEPLPIADLVILPGTKATIADLAFFAPRAGTSISSPMSGAAGGSLGICGGYQMLGRASPTRGASKGRRAKFEGSG